MTGTAVMVSGMGSRPVPDIEQESGDWVEAAAEEANVTGTYRRARSEPSGAALLGIYLNDHLAGATGGVELARRAARGCRGSATGAALEALTAEIAEDRAGLLDIMAALGISARQYKIYAAWVGEKVGRLKLNGRLVGRSPLSTLVELEALRLGVEGKAAGWRSLRALADLADREPRLDPTRLDELIDRARQQSQTLEELRLRTAAEIFAPVKPG
jgi:hypothetical protein